MGRSRAKVPTLNQKRAISKAGLDWKDFLVIKQDAESITVVRKGDGKTRVIRR